MPAVAIVIPAYNAARTLAATLDSVRAQTLADFEAIVVDDGSTDETTQIAAAVACVDSRFRLIRKTNSGVADARNAGLMNSTAQLIAPLDADDVWHPLFLQKLASVLASAPDVVLAYANTRLIDMSARVLRNAPSAQRDGHVYEALMLRNFIGNGSAMMFRRTAALRVGGFDRRLQHEYGAEGAEDWLLAMCIAAQGRVVAVRDYLVGYRATPDAMSSNVLRTRRSRLHALRTLLAHDVECSATTRRRALGRAHGKCCLRECLAGEWRAAARSFASALREDWLGTCHLLLGAPRWRWFRETLCGVHESAQLRHFLDFEPCDKGSVPEHPTDEPRWWRLDATASAREALASDVQSIAAVAREVHPK